jgi:hypothetical protein
MRRGKHAAKVTCGDIEEDFDCDKPASRIAMRQEWTGFAWTLRRVAVCRRHGRAKRRRDWYVAKASRAELLALAGGQRR